MPASVANSACVTLIRSYVPGAMHKILDACDVIRRAMSFEAHSAAQPSNKVLAIGVEGAGKSTTINGLLKAAAMTDEELKKRNPEKKVHQHFSPRYFASSEKITKEEVTAIEEGDAKLRAFVFDPELNHDINKMERESLRHGRTL